ncbi:YolD-like family protein [Mammaliicoccus sciuri]
MCWRRNYFINSPATIKYWEDGYYKTIECEINKFDSERNKLEVLENDEKVLLSMDCIVEIE